MPKRFLLYSKTTGFYPQTLKLEQPSTTPALTFSVAVNGVNLPQVKIFFPPVCYLWIIMVYDSQLMASMKAISNQEVISG